MSIYYLKYASNEHINKLIVLSNEQKFSFDTSGFPQKLNSIKFDVGSNWYISCVSSDPFLLE